MTQIAVSSYISPEYPAWPNSGPVRLADVRKSITEGTDALLESFSVNELFPVVPIPCDDLSRFAYLHWQSQASWVVLEVADDQCSPRDDGFIEFETADVVFNGTVKEAVEFLRGMGLTVPKSTEPICIGEDWQDVSSGDSSIVIAGQDGNAMAGSYSLAYASTGRALVGDHAAALSKYGVVSAGNYACAWTSDGPMARAGLRSVACTAWEGGKSEVGNGSVAIAEDYGHAVAGNYSTAIAGAHGAAEAGDHGVAMAKEDGKVRAGKAGVLMIRWKGRIKVAQVGDEVEAGTWYSHDAEGRFVKCEPPDQAT
jgi:hypothetical protein